MHPWNNATLMRYARGELPAEAFVAVSEHLDTCAECRRKAADFARATETHPAQETGRATIGSVLQRRFFIDEFVGQGASGSIYRARDQWLDCEVALKVLRPELGAEDYLALLAKEILLGRRVSHENVCRTHDLGRAAGLHFVSMEFIRGRTLEQVILGRQMPKSTVLQLLLQLCNGLEAAHRAGVIHRDLKPSNLMITADGTLKIMDFGLAQYLRATMSVRFGPVGTPAYWSPEQARGERATERSDIYALGVIAYQMLTGNAPHARVGERAMDRLPTSLRSVVQRCLADDAKHRPRSVGEVRNALLTHARRPLRTGLVGALAAGVLTSAAVVPAALQYPSPTPMLKTISPLPKNPWTASVAEPKASDATVLSDEMPKEPSIASAPEVAHRRTVLGQPAEGPRMQAVHSRSVNAERREATPPREPVAVAIPVFD